MNSSRKINKWALLYGVFFMLPCVIYEILLPIEHLGDIFKVMRTGYAVPGDFIHSIALFTAIIYFSLRSKTLYKIYTVFPWLYELVKYLTITNIFISLAGQVLNSCYMELSFYNKFTGIAFCIIILVFWRVFISALYSMYPLSKFIETTKQMKEEKVKPDFDEIFNSGGEN